MEFLQSISELGILQTKPPKRVSESEQLTKMRENFSIRATRQITLIKGGNRQKSGSWYITTPNDAGTLEYVLALRNGAKVIPLAGQMTHVRVEDAEQAIGFYELAIAACERGELDAALKATCRKPSRTKTPSQAIEASTDATAAAV